MAQKITNMNVKESIAASMLNPATPDLQEFVFVFYNEVNAILWNYLLREQCSKVCLVKWNKTNKELFDTLFIYGGDSFCLPFKMRIRTQAGNKDFYYEFEDVTGICTPNFPNGNTMNDFVKLFVNDLDNISKDFGVMSIPTVVAFKNGKEVKRNSGFMSEDDLNDFLEEI